jgi:hypothetical protein
MTALMDAMNDKIREDVLSLRALCHRAEEEADRSDATGYARTVAEIETARAELQFRYTLRRRILAGTDSSGRSDMDAA